MIFQLSTNNLLSQQASWEQVVELVLYKPMKGRWWSYEYIWFSYMFITSLVVQGSTVKKKSWNQLVPYFSFLVAWRNILVAKNYLKKIEYNVLKVFILTSAKSSISYRKSILNIGRLKTVDKAVIWTIPFQLFVRHVLRASVQIASRRLFEFVISLLPASVRIHRKLFVFPKLGKCLGFFPLLGNGWDNIFLSW